MNKRHKEPPRARNLGVLDREKVMRRRNSEDMRGPVRKELWEVLLGASPVAQLVKNQPARQETWVQSLGWEDPLAKGKATYSSILAWRIQSMGSLRIRHD